MNDTITAAELARRWKSRDNIDELLERRVTDSDVVERYRLQATWALQDFYDALSGVTAGRLVRPDPGPDAITYDDCNSGGVERAQAKSDIDALLAKMERLTAPNPLASPVWPDPEDFGIKEG
jgi:hypothetical protein